MVIFETYWKRQKKLRGELPDVYTYDEIPDALRVQIVQITMEAIGDKNSYYTSRYSDNIQHAYKKIVVILQKELGVFRLPHLSNHYEDCLAIELGEYILREQSVEHILSAIEIICHVIEDIVSQFGYRGNRNSADLAQEFIDEINGRFKEHGLGYEYDGEIIRIDTELVHSEAVKPALGLLRNANFFGAEQEFLSAYAHYRKGNYKEALNDALKAFESTMKSIYEKRQWNYNKTDPASKLIKVAFDNGLVPSFWESHFSALRTTLEAGVPTARNKLSGHGQGAKPTSIPSHLAAYVLHLTAANIVYLVKSDEALP